MAPPTSIPLPLLAASLFALVPVRAAAYSWHFQAPPQQCANLSISIDSGSSGRSPYRVLVIPFGPTPLKNSIEARRIIDVPFSDNANSVSFQLKYPANSQFVTVVSDASGFGSGGTSVAALVTESSDSSCFDGNTNVQPDFFFNIDPPNQLVQCQPMRIWWDKSTVKGTPQFLGVIPGGQSFSIPQSSITDVQGLGTGFSWTPSLRGGTTLLLVGGDDRGNGTAGSVLNTVSNGLNNNVTCLSDASPSSTPGSPAGGSYPTSSSGSNSSGGGSSSNKTGAIVGGVIGGIALLLAVLLALFFLRRRNQQAQKRRTKERPMDLLNAEEDDSDEGGPHSPTTASGQTRRQSRNELPEYYQPQPYTIPAPTLSAYSQDGHTTEGGRPISGNYTVTSRSDTPDLLSPGGTGSGGQTAGSASGTSATGRKGPMRQMRTVNVIQHDDAGTSLAVGGEAEDVETVELPPAYTNIRRD